MLVLRLFCLQQSYYITAKPLGEEEGAGAKNNELNSRVTSSFLFRYGYILPQKGDSPEWVTLSEGDFNRCTCVRVSDRDSIRVSDRDSIRVRDSY